MARSNEQISAFEHGTTCSRCSAAPLVKFTSEALGLDLPFCGHHASKNEPALISQGFTITVDLRQGGSHGPNEQVPLASV